MKADTVALTTLLQDVDFSRKPQKPQNLQGSCVKSLQIWFREQDDFGEKKINPVAIMVLVIVSSRIKTG